MDRWPGYEPGRWEFESPRVYVINTWNDVRVLLVPDDGDPIDISDWTYIPDAMDNLAIGSAEYHAESVSWQCTPDGKQPVMKVNLVRRGDV